ncbi:MAG: hypothetical protein HC927_06030 [Deltaproteobacteria bacterium]|nr:hypothetical protein [Deltaproteobacteria bacterium]
MSPLLDWSQPLGCLYIGGTQITDISLLLEIEWQQGYVFACNSSCPQLSTGDAPLDDFSKDVVIPQLCEMGVNVDGCLVCPQ